ncbi:hypothetical protein FNW52_07565 [Flavobacterium sp. ZT3R18]|uniref:hypothetical protein n=1 Tax=Flavobacterium sp. ZT3R18 TaxID=2594429 RepID=UPI00117AC118|nr:hypothetical protein [Flavobacterium sp. ZT3R18]TRX36461.1 hypothetical protein FNW52_07565 [Flavobacterium sp. ZT3R18]
MKYSFFKRMIGILLLLLSFSCSSDLDFNQANDFNVQPVFTTNLAYFEAKAPNFVINGVERSVFSYSSNVDFFTTSFIENDLVKADLYFRIKNTIARAYVLNVTFLDKMDRPIYSMSPMNVPASNGTEILVERNEIFSGTNVDILKNTTKMVFSIEMLAGPPLTANSTGRVELSSSITAYFDVK